MRRDEAALSEAVLLDHLHAAVRRDRDQQVERRLRALLAAHHLLGPVDFLHVEQRLVGDAEAVDLGRGPLRHVLERVHAADRVGVVDLGLVEDAAVLEVVVQHERDLERRHRALVRHADGDHHVAALEASQALEHLERRLLRVELLGVLGEPGNRLGHRPRAGRDHEHVVGGYLAALGLHLVLVELELLDGIDMELDRRARAGSPGRGRARRASCVRTPGTAGPAGTCACRTRKAS